MQETSVVIVGGGIAGAALGCALAQRKIRSVIIERRREPVDLNRGDGLQPRTLEILDTWGVLPRFVEAGALRSYGIELHHPVFGQLLEIDLGVVETPYPYMLNLPHQEIEKLLLQFAEASTYCQVIHAQAREVLFEGGRAVGVRITAGDSNLELRGASIVGADGAHSMVRKSAGIAAPMQDYDHELLVLHAERPAWFSGRLRTRAFMHRQGSIVLLPLPEERMRVAVLLPAGSGGQWKELPPEELHNRLARRWPALAAVRSYESHGEHIYRMRRMHVPSYSRRGVVLVGDAAHLTHAAGGQGMNMAVQDAEVLAEEISRSLAGQVPLEEAYRRYEARRRPLNEAVIKRAHFLAGQLWVPSLPRFFARTALSLSLRYLLPFAYRRMMIALAWGNAGVDRRPVAPVEDSAEPASVF